MAGAAEGHEETEGGRFTEAMMTRAMAGLVAQQNEQMRLMTENMGQTSARLLAQLAEHMKLIQKPETTEKKGHEEKSDEEDNKNNKILEKSYKRLDKFEGGELQWNLWKEDFEVMTRSANGLVGQTLKDAADSKTPFDATNLKKTLQMRSKELYEVLFMITSGEAKVQIKSSTEDGFRAWQILNQTYSRKTLAKMLRRFREASNPPQATTLNEVVMKIGEWEGKVSDMNKMTGKKFDPMLKLAALIEIRTPELKDLVFQNIDDHPMESEEEMEKAYTKV